MSRRLAPPTEAEPITETLYGYQVADPYRWLEDSTSARTRAWIDKQTHYARAYLDDIPGRDFIRRNIRKMLSVDTCDSFLKSGNRYFFRKRLSTQEQVGIYILK